MNWTKHINLFYNSINYTLKGEGFYISYNENPSLPLFGGSDNGSDETALCKDGQYYILNGDFRASYERLIEQGYKACKKFYDQQAAHADSSWSTTNKKDKLNEL